MSRPWPRPLAAVWFDLDGTLIDSAPDLYQACLAVCREQGRAAPAYEIFRTRVSRGGRAMLQAAFPEHDAAAIEALLPRFLALYEACLDGLTRPFEGMPAVLDDLAARGIAWGVVTNKSEALGVPLLERLGLLSRAAACVYGDSLAVRKPDPGPLLHVCRQIGVAPEACVFVGDDARDIEAGRAAGMYSIAAAWGYLDGGDPHAWRADAVVETVSGLAQRLAQAPR